MSLLGLGRPPLSASFHSGVPRRPHLLEPRSSGRGCCATMTWAGKRTASTRRGSKSKRAGRAAITEGRKAGPLMTSLVERALRVALRCRCKRTHTHHITSQAQSCRSRGSEWEMTGSFVMPDLMPSAISWRFCKWSGGTSRREWRRNGIPTHRDKEGASHRPPHRQPRHRMQDRKTATAS